MKFDVVLVLAFPLWRFGGFLLRAFVVYLMRPLTEEPRLDQSPIAAMTPSVKARVSAWPPRSRVRVASLASAA